VFHLGGVVSAGLPIQDIASPSHDVLLRWFDPGRTELALADGARVSGNRDVILRDRLTGETISAGRLLDQGGDENLFLFMAEPPQAVPVDDVPAREYIFVVDVSGSMHGFPLDTGKTLMRDLTNVLRPSDTFNVVVFADGTDTFAPVSVSATGPNLARALHFVGRKDGGGGTHLLAALQRAVALPRQPTVSRSIVLLTDGYVAAEADVFEYIRDQLDDTNFFAFGIGSSVNRFLIEGVARAGLGEPFIVTDPNEAIEAASRLRRYIDSPVLTGIHLTFAGFDVYDVEPRQIPDLFARRPIVVFGKWRGAANGSIELSGNTGHGVYQTSTAVAPASADPRHGALRHLWARTRIANLSDFSPSAPSPSRVAEITSLGLAYGLLTRYTSFVAVHELVRRTTEGADDVDQPLPLPAGVSDRAVGVTSGAEPELVWMSAIVAALLACAWLLGMTRPRPGVVA
jgi:Ca-activated chloride channel family protein